MKFLHISIIATWVFIGSTLSAQVAWIEPDPIDAEDSVTIFVDLTQTECQRLKDHPGPLYMWTWLPAEPVVENGSWTESNEEMAMKDEGNNIWSKTFIPTEFYGVDAEKVFENDFHFLVKASDGTGDGGGGCDEDKTEDLKIEVDPPTSGPQKVKSFPATLDAANNIAMTADDYFSLIYDNNLEEKVTMQNNSKDLYVYARATLDNGTVIKVVSLSKVDETPALKMSAMGDGTYQYTIVANELFADVIPAGNTLTRIRFQIVQEGFTSANETVDGEYIYYFKCD